MQKTCLINFTNTTNNSIAEVEEKILESIKEDLTNGYNVSNIDAGNDAYIYGIKSNFTISNTYNQKHPRNSNLSTIDFTTCETNLKLHYNISLNKSLYILKVDVEQKGMKISKTVYEVYYPINNTNLIKLDLSICKNDKIDLYYPLDINYNENMDKFDLKSNYYNDFCYPTTSEKGTDISLKDRKNEFFDNNLTLCPEDCILSNYNKTINKSKCNCDIIIDIPLFFSEIKINKSKLYDSFDIENIKNILNYKLLKCYKVLLKKKVY